MDIARAAPCVMSRRKGLFGRNVATFATDVAWFRDRAAVAARAVCPIAWTRVVDGGGGGVVVAHTRSPDRR